MAAQNKSEARIQARSVINNWAMGFAAVAWIPGSHYVMTAGDLTMVIQVGSIFGVDLTRTAAANIFTTVAAPLIGSKLAHSILDFVPGIGWAAKSAVAVVVTRGVGEALIGYFNDCSKLPESENFTEEPIEDAEPAEHDSKSENFIEELPVEVVELAKYDLKLAAESSSPVNKTLNITPAPKGSRYQETSINEEFSPPVNKILHITPASKGSGYQETSINHDLVIANTPNQK